jgi:hypothetical protein
MGGVSCATAKWLAKPIVASVVAIGPSGVRPGLRGAIEVWCWRARMADVSSATRLTVVALCSVGGRHLARCALHRFVGIGFRARELLRDREDRWNLRGNRVLHAERARKRLKIQEATEARLAPRSAGAGRAAGSPYR